VEDRRLNRRSLLPFLNIVTPIIDILILLMTPEGT
jgi:hypothetical protein